MPDPLVTFSVVKFLWDESRSARSSVWRKLPFAKDAEKRSLAEQELGRLLDDTNKLGKNLSPGQAEEAIDKRLAQFEETLLQAKIPPEQVETLVDRASIYVKVMITQPLTETTSLRVRISELEKAIENLEGSAELQRLKLESIEAAIRGRQQDRSVPALWVGFGVLALVEAVQLLYLLLRGSH